MTNEVILIGRLVKKPEKVEEEKWGKITLAINREDKNEMGIYETDFVNICLYKNAYEKVIEFCDKGDLIAVCGKIRTENIDERKVLQIIAEKISFIAPKRSVKEANENE